MINRNYLIRLFLLVNGKKNYKISYFRKNFILTPSFLFLIVNGFIPIAYAEKAVILNFDDDWKGQFTYADPFWRNTDSKHLSL